MGRDVRLLPQRIEGYRNFANKLWNAARFVLMNLDGGGPGAVVTAEALGRGERPASLSTADRWIVSRLETTVGAVREAMDAYRFNDVADRLYQFTWHELCDWYVEAAKPPLAESGEAADRVRGVLLHTLERLLRALHPVMPFVTEEIWQAIVAEGWGARREERFAASIMIASYPRVLEGLVDAASEAAFERVIGVVREVRNHRATLQAPPTEAVSAALSVPDSGVRRGLEAEQSLMETLGRCRLSFAAASPRRGGWTAVLDGLEVHFPPDPRLADAIVRIEKDLVALEREYGGVAKKLANPEFIEKAPDEVVEEVRAKAAQLEAKRAVLARQRDQLRAAE